ncbi:Putative velvet factor [Septoria linicola]|uniref:Velvet factor n=1 Tax=Septoria linicola TaxID=215465 RepID=A0A9Q9AUC5_9PEZI|nr:putative velvet factor [Septoria linicola]USW52288.1 Putative velvet factor [Septoria linicola]
MMARDQVRLEVRQEPKRAQVVQENNPKNRKPIDPPPIIELKYNDRDDPTNAQWLVSPRTFMMVTLISTKDEHELAPGKLLIGQTVSSLHRLKDINNKDGGFFVFGDISAKRLGSYKLRFSLFDTNKDTEEVVFLASIDSTEFPVVAQRDFGSMSESTHLTRTFSDQGVKLRVRKDNRAISSISGQKRSYNQSPPDTTSPSGHPSMHPGAVQDYHYNTSQAPAVKRQRSSSEYENSSLYQTSAIPDTPNSNYTIPSSTRYAMAHNDYQRGYSSYAQYSPGGVVSSRPMQMQPAGWQSVQQNSALPSPTPSVSGQQQSAYPATAGQQASMFGDPGGVNSIPRATYPASSYPYPQQAHYSSQPGADGHQYPDLQMPSDTSGLSSSQSNPYGATYLQSANLYATEANEASGAYAYAESQTRGF